MEAMGPPHESVPDYGGALTLAGLAFREHLGPLFISPDAIDFVTEVSMGSCLVEKGRLKFETPEFCSAVLCAVKSLRPNVSYPVALHIASGAVLGIECGLRSRSSGAPVVSCMHVHAKARDRRRDGHDRAKQAGVDGGYPIRTCPNVAFSMPQAIPTAEDLNALAKEARLLASLDHP